MKDYILNRVIENANYIIETKATVRECAKHFGISKSTVHSDLCYKLKEIDLPLYIIVQSIMVYNYSVKHIRGGESTKKIKLKARNSQKA